MTVQQLVAQARAEINEILVADAAAAVAGAVLIDVREPAEFDSGRLAGAVNIPRGVLEFKAAENPLLADKERRIFLYCKSGGRSALAAQSLQRLGYTRIESIAGGIDEWLKQNRAIVTDTTLYGG